MATQTDRIPQGLPNGGNINSRSSGQLYEHGRLRPKKRIPHPMSFAPTPPIGSAPYQLWQPQSFWDGMKAAVEFEQQLQQQQAALWNLLHPPMIASQVTNHKQAQ